MSTAITCFRFGKLRRPLSRLEPPARPVAVGRRAILDFICGYETAPAGAQIVVSLARLVTGGTPWVVVRVIEQETGMLPVEADMVADALEAVMRGRPHNPASTLAEVAMALRAAAAKARKLGDPPPGPAAGHGVARWRRACPSVR